MITRRRRNSAEIGDIVDAYCMCIRGTYHSTRLTHLCLLAQNQRELYIHESILEILIVLPCSLCTDTSCFRMQVRLLVGHQSRCVKCSCSVCGRAQDRKSPQQPIRFHSHQKENKEPAARRQPKKQECSSNSLQSFRPRHNKWPWF